MGRKNDRVPLGMAMVQKRSLYLVRPNNLFLQTLWKSYRRRVWANFELCGEEYCIPVTDPWVEDKYWRTGTKRFPEALICISLGEKYGIYAYKLAAAVITSDSGNG